MVNPVTSSEANRINVAKCKTLPLMTFMIKKSALLSYCYVFEFIGFKQQ